TIPDAKERALKILEFSSMPGTSRHHWGTDIDFNSFENSYFAQGKGLKEYQWLDQNAARFGFCQTYSEKGESRPTGYNLEKWHWSYLPVAQALTKFAAQHLKDEDIQGFAGAETAPSIGVVERYILGINPACK
ncbi:MAG: D-alanyl-D-alanine carboxypeptidase family protein, partial [Bacteroidota bacterium]